MRCFRILMMLVSVGAVPAMVVPAHAVKGVKYVHFDPAYTECLPDQALPCPPDSGEGESNVVYVHQQKINQQYVFDGFEVPGGPDDHFWVAVSFGAECKFGYHLDGAAIATGWYDAEGRVFEVVPGTETFIVPHGGFSTKIDDHVINLWVPAEGAFEQEDIDAPSSVFSFDTAEDVFDYAEGVIADRVASGMSEEAARNQSFFFDTYLAMHGYAWCKGNSFGRKFYISRSEWLPLRFVFVGLGDVAHLELQDPSPPEPGPDDLTAGVAVTQAFLYVAPDKDDSCRLRLSGVFGTNGPTEISYRFVDELGLESQIFTTQVDQTYVSMVDHYVDLPVVERPDHQIDDFWLEDGDGHLGDLIHRPTDNVQGYYQIEVLEPHGYWSNVASYNVEPCYEDLPVPGGFKAPTRLPPPPGRPGNKAAN